MKLNQAMQVAGCCTLAVALLGVGGATQSKKTTKVPYAKVEPLLKAKCISCHNPERHPGGVNVNSYKELMKSGDKNPTVVPGHPEKSPLIKYVDGSTQPIMPFKGKPLSKAEVTLLKNWVAAGAKQ
jgi:hypothetical protein